VIRNTAVITLAAAALAACATALPQTAPLRPAPAAWTQSEATAPATDVEDRWWLAFNDPALNAIIDSAEQADDIALAEARLAQAVARLGAARSRLRPELSLGGSAEHQAVDDLEQDQLSALVNLAWSPDLNGAIAARRDAASAQVRAGQARLAAIRQAVRAAAVRLYIAHGEAQARERAALASVAALEDSLNLAASRERAGLVSGLDPVSARAQLAAARVAPLAAREAAEESRLGLEALLGLKPGDLAAQLSSLAEIKATATEPVLLSPVSVMSRRPDLIAAGQDLAAAGYDALAARRDFWPTLSLGAALGGYGVDPETPFSVSGGLLRAGAQLGAPLFSFGRLEGARDEVDARRSGAAIAYRQTATRALSEVEQALNAVRSAQARRTALEAASQAGVDRAALAASRHRAGLEPVLNVLIAQDQLAQTHAALASARADAARAHAALCIAMGLGAL
jgi:outer membrane protein, multidrug efflux system